MASRQLTALLPGASDLSSWVARNYDGNEKPDAPAEFREFLAHQAYEPLALDSQQFSERIRTELAKWQKVVRERNIKIEQ